MKRIIIILIAAAAIISGYLFWKNSEFGRQDSGIEAPAVLNPEEPGDSTAGEDRTGLFLDVPENFIFDTFAENLPGARVMALDDFGNMWVSRTRYGAISLVEMRDGRGAVQGDILRNLDGPHGLVFDPESPSMLYYAETGKISRLPAYSDGSPEKIADLPGGGLHSTRTLLFGQDGRLYVSIGSTCDVCNETNQQRAKIFSMNKDGSDFREEVVGLRNSVFMAIDPATGKIWATEMGVDVLGDDLPPDEINIIERGNDYGWPNCFGKNVHDDRFDPQKRVSCDGKTPSHIDIPAHSAPLGLAFIPKEEWPEDFQDDLLVAFHGSIARSQPTGYKIVRMKLDENRNFISQEDFITGWLKNGEVSGRPAGIITQPGGIAYISDDRAGVVYKLEYRK